MAKKKLLFVNNSLGQGGAEKALIELLGVLDPEKYEVYLYLMVNRGEFFSQLPSFVQVLNGKPDPRSILTFSGQMACMKAVAVSSLRRGSLVRDLPYIWKNRDLPKAGGTYTLRALLSWKVLSDGAPRFPQEFDLAVAYLEGGATYYVADHVKAKRKAAFVHVDYQESGYTRGLDHGCYDWFDRVYTVSDSVKDSFLKVHPEQAKKTQVFHNIINAPLIREKAKEAGFTDSFAGKRLVTLGRLHALKGYDLAMEALKLLLESGCDVRWYVLGEGPEREKLEKLRASLGLEDRFILMGSKANPYPYVAQADLYVHCTRSEGKSVAIEEAQVLHKPILASDIPGNRGQIDSGKDGVLVELEASAVAREIRRMLADPELCGTCAEGTKAHVFDYEKDLEGFLSLIAKEGDHA